ncbi:MAG: 3'-5' exonuclease [Candidatus Omnitrophica bacterium]|nr:3'-5' exonuclease [Candidatus Omnitrophota bacterium]MBU1808256.1 3'-5' exonuclease [Candidatus Omnitrophota bacterium]
MKLEEAVFTIFDFETTGLYPYTGDRICEIGALRFGVNSVKPRRFHSLIDPKRRISYGAFRINGITDAMVRGKPVIAEVLPEFLKFISGSVLVAYNAGFDVGFLEASLGGSAVILEDYYIIDALKLARRLFPGIGRYGLGSVAGSLSIKVVSEHRAIADAIMTWKVFKKELSILSREGVKTVEDIDRFRMRSSPSLSTVKDYKTHLVEEAIDQEKRLNIV